MDGRRVALKRVFIGGCVRRVDGKREVRLVAFHVVIYRVESGNTYRLYRASVRAVYDV